MSYEIVYDRRFIRTPLGITPLILAGSNNCYEPMPNGRERRERNWSVLFNFPVATEDELMNAVHGCCGSRFQEHFKWHGKFVNDAGFVSFVQNGIANAVTLERDVEKLVLFLERCYVSGISMEESEEVKRMFIELAMRKAREIGAEVVLSNQYRECSALMGFTAMQHYLYISKSKGGKQYLDSLGGSCNVTNEGSYRKEMVMILAGERGKA